MLHNLVADYPPHYFYAYYQTLYRCVRKRAPYENIQKVPFKKIKLIPIFTKKKHATSELTLNTFGLKDIQLDHLILRHCLVLVKINKLHLILCKNYLSRYLKT